MFVKAVLRDWRKKSSRGKEEADGKHLLLKVKFLEKEKKFCKYMRSSSFDVQRLQKYAVPLHWQKKVHFKISFQGKLGKGGKNSATDNLYITETHMNRKYCVF
jgi:hypothetical protein